jgi:DNA-directed RNA polymerase subunit RPC12/RpoP
MKPQTDLFGFDPAPRRKPKKLMHVVDACADECGETSGAQLVMFGCQRCGHETDWVEMPNVTSAKRGVPCPVCNPAEVAV